LNTAIPSRRFSSFSQSSALSPQSLLIFLALVAYCLPWLLNPGVSLSYGVYDLAEWTSLHSAVRASSPSLLLTLVLRLPLVCLTIVVEFSRRQVLLRTIFVFIIAAALLPPLEFFTQYPDDPNYRQQLVLAVAAFLIGGIGLSGLLSRWHHIIRLTASFAGAIAAIWGLAQAYELMNTYQLPVRIGVGGILFISFCIIFGVTQIQETRQPTPPRRISQSQLDKATS
jgi:hypothetical protein